MEKTRIENGYELRTTRSTDKKYGELTVFLGAMSGVGKTYAMLEAARVRIKEGIDTKVGWINSNQHPEILDKLNGLPLVKPRNISYGEDEAQEMDVDEIIRLAPEIVIIDELAHTNAPGSLRSKRYRDVEAILMAGIDVYTTLNIYEIESLNDVAANIIGLEIRDTVPDTFLEKVNRIQVIDVPHDELVKRFKDKKIHTNDTQPQLQRLYRPGNIIALRELLLRFVAQSLDKQLDEYMRSQKIEGPWPVAEKVMVCVSPSPFSKELVRNARQMAASLKTEWIAVYVETPQRRPRNEQERMAIASNLQLAEDLGAKVFSIPGSNVAEEIVMLARKHNVKQIVIGKPKQTRISEWLNGSVVDQVIRSSTGISVHVIPGKAEHKLNRGISNIAENRLRLTPYLIISTVVVLFTLFLHLIRTNFSFDLVNIALLYLFPVLLGATRWGIGPSIYAAGIGVLAFDFFFVPPYYSFTVADLRYIISFVVFLAVAILTASLASRLRQQLREVREREAITSALYSVSRQMTAVDKIDSALDGIVRHLSEMIGCPITILLPNESEDLKVTASSNGDMDLGRAESDMVIADWVYHNGDVAGRGTQTLRETPNLYVPLRTEDQIHGVMVIHDKDSGLPEMKEHMRLIESIAGLAAMTIARIKLQEEAKIAHLTAESERIRTALLDSISHELRTPLATIIGSVTALMDGDTVFNQEDRRELLYTIREGAMRMNRLIKNLLGMVRLESGMLRLNKHWCDIEDIIGVSIKQVKDSLQNRDLQIEVAEALPPLMVDDVLLEQVLVNTLSNAIKYSPDQSKIVLSAEQDNNTVILKIKDEGIGIPSHESDKIFEKFYRGKTASHITGTGLGLAICKGIIDAHGGKIEARPNKEKGTVITISLPLINQSNIN